MAQTGQPPDDDDIRFGDDIDEVLSRANPNPERIGCPPRETLIALARRAQPLGDPAYEHLVKCSPCYREFRKLQQEHSTRRPVPAATRYRWRPAVAAAVLVAGLGVGWWFTRGSAPSTGPSLERTAQIRAELDLRKYSALRRQESAPAPEPLVLPIGIVDLTLLLPVGSEAGAYDVQLLDGDLKSRATSRGVGDIRDFVTTVRATLDLRSVSQGDYQLALRRDGDDWRMFPARVR